MKNIRFLIGILAIVLIIGMSCNRFGYSHKKYNGESFVIKLVDLIDYYSADHNKYPQSAEDLIIYVSSMNSHMAVMGYMGVYNYLEDNKDKLIFVTKDSLVSIYYKEIDEKNLFISMEPDIDMYCRNPRTRADIITFFDERGYYTEYWSLEKYLYARMREINMKYSAEKTENHYLTVIEYTPAGLKNLCNNESIDVEQSDWYKEIYELFDGVAKEHHISRIVFRNFVMSSISD